ncbi:MAG: DUF1844 domain-containing protein [Candidatus Woesearchaeota archaeon]
MQEFESEFVQLVIGLQGSCWMLLGKIANPVTGKEECNLDAAKSVIDTLLMLKEKTKGNLSKEEQSILDSALQQLQLNYVAELEKPDEQVAEKVESGQEEPDVAEK